MKSFVVLTLCLAVGAMLASHADWHLLATQGAVIAVVAVCMTAIVRSDDALEIARLRAGESELDRRDDDDDKGGPSAPSDGAAEGVA